MKFKVRRTSEWDVDVQPCKEAHVVDIGKGVIDDRRASYRPGNRVCGVLRERCRERWQEMSDEPKQVECPECGGYGVVGEIVEYVTRDMAIDAGDMDYEGMPYETIQIQCNKCGGYGVVEVEASNE